MTIEEAVHLAQQYFQSARPGETEALCRQIVAADPQNVEALNLLGAVAGSQGRLAEAIDAFAKVAALRPEIAQVQANLGLALYQSAQLDVAAAACRRALELRPDHVDALLTLGNVLQDQAAALDAMAYLDEAIASFAQVVHLQPDRAAGHYNLANAMGKRGRVNDAIEAYRKAIQLSPDCAEAHTNLGNALQARGEFSAAIAAHRRAVELKPDFADAYNNMAAALFSIYQVEPAMAACRAAIALKPDLAAAYNNLGNALRSIGDAPGAIAEYDNALIAKPDAAEIASNRIFTLQFLIECDSALLAGEMKRWDQKYAAPPHKHAATEIVKRSDSRRLRIGYVSSDFRDHVVGWHMLPLVRGHDREQFQIFCYSTFNQPDRVTERIQSSADVWRDIATMSNARAAELIRADAIDILVDLSLHSGGNRLLLFAQKPAPVQVSYLGYCGSAGMGAIDYFFSDQYITPPHEPDWGTGRVVRLPQTYWCYQPPDRAPPVGPGPVNKNGYITFGCLNNFAKISPAAWDAWERILSEVGRSRLLVHAPPGEHQEKLRARLGADRIEFIGRQNLWPYLLTYERMDIALDPFPYGGGITTCDGLWMGTPLVSLVGKTPVGRGGLSVLSTIGLADLAGRDANEYVNIAVKLAGDVGRLNELRLGLRQRMSASPLMDTREFVRDIEAAYQEMWARPA